jgi:hypothetical protein
VRRLIGPPSTDAFTDTPPAQPALNAEHPVISSSAASVKMATLSVTSRATLRRTRPCLVGR